MSDLPPRWLGPAEAAAYLSIRPDRLMPLVRAGRIPRPCYALGPRRPRWDRLALDARLGGGEASLDANRAVAAAAAAIAAGR
ncbi:MAG: hypothetical protein N2688_00105 [Burkholderiaceae bacterium]|nr:hypothetical protein [Burkholderiaceae bacterium]